MNQTMDRIASATAGARQGELSRRIIPRAYQVARDDLGRVAVTYHWTDVAVFDRNEVTLDNGGFYTPTTKAVINAALASTPYYVYQKRFQWFVSGYPDGIDRVFSNGMMLCLSSGSAA